MASGADLFLTEQPTPKKEVIKQDDIVEKPVVKEEESYFTDDSKPASLLNIAEESKPVKRT